MPSPSYPHFIILIVFEDKRYNLWINLFLVSLPHPAPPLTWLIPVSVKVRVLSLCIILHRVKILWVLFPLRLLLETIYSTTKPIFSTSEPTAL